jgi:hypothetical protein
MTNSHARRFGGAFLLMLLAAVLSMIGCGATTEQPSQEVVHSTEQAITTACTTDANCTGGTAPACADVTTGICSAGTCYYTMHPTNFPPSGCYCVEGDVQDCKTSGSMTYDGVQTCQVVTSSPLLTGWGACASSSPFVGHTPGVVSNETMRKCTGTVTCGNIPDRPVCATYDFDVCTAPSAPKECIWMRAAEHGCSCIQYDIRTCTKSGGGTGHQMCDVTGSDPLNVDWGFATGWGTCS